METDKIKEMLITSASIPPYSVPGGAEWARTVTICLLCDILDELRKNASNREKALKDYGIKL